MAIDYAEVDALLKSESLRLVEEAIAAIFRKAIVRDSPTFSLSESIRKIGLTGKSVEDIRAILDHDKNLLVDFGCQFLRDEEAARVEEEYPEGEEPEKEDQPEKSLGFMTGFGIEYAVYLHYLRDRSTADFHAYLKARRIPKHVGFAKVLKRVFDADAKKD